MRQVPGAVASGSDTPHALYREDTTRSLPLPVLTSLLFRAATRITCQQSRSDCHAICSQFGRYNRSSFKARLERTFAGFFDDGLEDQIAGLHDRATQNYPLDAQKVDHAGDRDAYRGAGALDHHDRKIVAFVRFASHVAGGEVF